MGKNLFLTLGLHLISLSEHSPTCTFNHIAFTHIAFNHLILDFQEKKCLVPWQIWRLENLTGNITIRKFVKFQNGQKIKQISNGRKIILRFENLFVN